MVILRSGNNGVSRDEVVSRGMRAAAVAERAYNHGKRTGQWLYKVKLKSGRRATRNAEYQAWNIPHLKAMAIIDQAAHNETLSATMIGRVMKSQMRSVREDV